MRSWKKKTSFQIKKWDENNFDIASAPLYVRQAYEAKKWAFVSDYVRLKALYEEGGIYLDTDCEILKDIGFLLDNDAFLAFECGDMVNTAIMGCKKGNPLLKEILDKYEKLNFYDNNQLNTTVTGRYVTEVFLQHGLKLDGMQQMVSGWTVYPFYYFYPVKLINNITYYREETCICHWWEGSWQLEEYRRAWRHDKNPLIKLFRKLPISKVYYAIRNRK